MTTLPTDGCQRIRISLDSGSTTTMDDLGSTDHDSIILEDLEDPFSDGENPVVGSVRTRVSSVTQGHGISSGSRILGHRVLQKTLSAPPMAYRDGRQELLDAANSSLSQGCWLFADGGNDDRDDNDNLTNVGDDNDDELVLHPWDPGYKRKTCIIKLDGCQYTIGNYV
ncbi:hypothetical protein LSH36_739g01009 [Paralvinella palmiformis]|uniref:Uncharacterized protein n=1 Tax=Paralvinella palmiformis TaxID=53620 RepID=A0AAD9J2B1_9ANNE|nr:hypothetical protein LSH36_739g01009 [Paralvinella palmiformis]